MTAVYYCMTLAGLLLIFRGWVRSHGRFAHGWMIPGLVMMFVGALKPAKAWRLVEGMVRLVTQFFWAPTPVTPAPMSAPNVGVTPALLPPTHPAAQPIPGAPIPWATIGEYAAIILAALVVLGLLVALGAHVRTVHRDRAVRLAADRDRRNQWNASINAYHTTMTEWGAYTTDIIAAWEYPMIGDTKDRRCRAFLDAQHDAERAKRAKYPKVPDLVTAFVDATDRMVTAWQVLEPAARRAGLRSIPAQYRHKVELAIRLLKNGLDPSVSPAERHEFISRARAEAEDAVHAEHLPLPQAALDGLDNAHRMALAAADATTAHDQPESCGLVAGRV